MSLLPPPLPAVASVAAWALLLCAAACGDAGAQSPSDGAGRPARAGEPVPDGTYRVAFAGQTLALVLRTGAGGEVVGRLVGPSLAFDLEGIREVDDDGEAAVEGVMVGGGTAGLVSLFPDEDGDYGFMVTPLGPDGAPLSAQTAMYFASYESPSTSALDVAGPQGYGTPGPATGATPGAPTSPGSGVLAGHPLVGRWATQVVLSSPAGGVATEMVMEFRPDGTLLDLGSRSMGGIPGVGGDTGFQPGGEEGRWRTEGNVLVVSYAGSPWVPFARFQLDGTRLGLTYLQDGSVQVWHRQGG